MKIKPGSEISSHITLTSVIYVIYSTLDIFTEVVFFCFGNSCVKLVGPV